MLEYRNKSCTSKPNLYVPCVSPLIYFNIPRPVSSIETFANRRQHTGRASPRSLCFCSPLSYLFGCSVCRVGGSASSSFPSRPPLQIQPLPSSSFHPLQPAPLLPCAVGQEILAEARAIDLNPVRIQSLLFWPTFVTFLGWWPDKLVSSLFANGLFLVSQVDRGDFKTTRVCLRSFSSARTSSSTTSRRTPRRTGRRVGSSCRSIS